MRLCVCVRVCPQVFIQMYADHPQFRMLLQCMTEEPDGPTNAGAAAAAQPDMPLTHAAWDPAAEGELAATLAAAARLIGAGHQVCIHKHTYTHTHTHVHSAAILSLPVAEAPIIHWTFGLPAGTR